MLAKWKIICRPKDQGGLGVIDLAIYNRCLLSKWFFNLINTDGAWQQLLRNKYLGDKSITQVGKKAQRFTVLEWINECKRSIFKYGLFQVARREAK
jgi:hypothetical protein